MEFKDLPMQFQEMAAHALCQRLSEVELGKVRTSS